MQQNNIEEIRKQILNKYHLRIGDRIKYNLLHTIYQGYVELFDEKTFAQEVLQISYGSYCQIKYNSNKRAILLKDEKVDVDLIREEILQKFSLKPGDKINYQKLCEIARQYEQTVDERTIAYEVLGISKQMLYPIKKNPNYSTTILSNRFEQNIDDLRIEILKNEGISSGDYINFEQLHRIAKKYKINDRDLAIKIFGIKGFNYYNIKNNPNRRTRILCEIAEKKEDKKDFIEEKTEEKIISLRNKIFESENIKPGITINYENFLILYAKYKSDIDERTFALRVLLIPQDKYLLIKRNTAKKTTICKELVEELEQNELDFIRQVVYDEYGIIEGEKINYERLTEIAEKWRDKIQEKDFAYKILGISEKSYYGMKYDTKKQSHVLNPRIKERADKIRYKIEREKRFYTLEEIEHICAESELTIDEFCSYVVQREMHKRIYLERNFYSELLHRKGKIFIGRGDRLSKEFARKNQKFIINFARSLAVDLCRTYQAKQHIEDYAQDTMLYVIENCGDLEKNFDDDFGLCKGLIYTRAKAFIKGKIIIGKKAKTISADSYYKNRKDNSLSIKSQDEDLETEVIDKVEAERDSGMLVKKVLTYIENGADPIETIRKIAAVNGLDFQNLIEQFRKYYKNSKNINGQEREQEKD